MIRPKDGGMNYEEIDELAWYYMFIAACVSEEENKILKEEWNKKGGHKEIPWWKFIMENTKVTLDIQKGDK